MACQAYLPAPPADGLDRGQALARDGGEDADELAVDDFNTIGGCYRADHASASRARFGETFRREEGFGWT
jgi:hypothetical protein